jgi:hypothetical protein
MTHEIAGDQGNVRPKVRNSAKDVKEKGVAHPGTHVNVAELDERAADE